MLFDPVAHFLDLFFLSVDDLLCPRLGRLVLAMLKLGLGHADRSHVVGDHPAVEGDVRVLLHHTLHHVYVHGFHALHGFLLMVRHVAHVHLAHVMALHHVAGHGHVALTLFREFQFLRQSRTGG